VRPGEWASWLGVRTLGRIGMGQPADGFKSSEGVLCSSGLSGVEIPSEYDAGPLRTLERQSYRPEFEEKMEGREREGQSDGIQCGDRRARG
jgi:hypothetical protein